MAEGQTIDYDALAQKHGGTAVIDYDALASKHGGEAMAEAAAAPATTLPTLPTNRAARRNAMAQPNVTVAQRADRANEIAQRFKAGFAPGSEVKNTATEPEAATAPRFAAPGSNVPIGEAISEASAASNLAIAGEVMGQPGTVGAVRGGVQLGKDIVQGTGTALAEAVDRFKVSRMTKKAAAANESLTKAIPSTKSTPYNATDVARARPHLEDQHLATGDITHVQGFVDAADSAIGKIEKHVDDVIAHNPNDTIGGHTDLRGAVKDALKGNVTKGFLDKGLKALEDTYDFSDDMKVADAKKLIRQLNDDNRAAMKSKNNYELQNMRNTDPEFAAREALARELRNGIFDKLEERGMPGIRELRQDQGSLIKMRDAAQAKINSGEAKVGGTQTAGMLRRGVGRVVKLGAIAKGAEMGGAPGAVAGAEVGEAAQQMIAPGNKTRNQLIQKAFSKPLTEGAAARFPELAARPQISGQLPTGAVVTAQPGMSVQTPAEVAAAAAQTRTAQTPSRIITRDPATGRMRVQYATSGGGETIYPKNVSRETMPPAAATKPAAQPAAPAPGNPESVARFLKERSAPKISTDSLGVKWAESNGVKVSIPKSVPEAEIGAYAKQKIAEQIAMRKKLGAQ